MKKVKQEQKWDSFQRYPMEWERMRQYTWGRHVLRERKTMCKPSHCILWQSFYYLLSNLSKVTLFNWLILLWRYIFFPLPTHHSRWLRTVLCIVFLVFACESVNLHRICKFPVNPLNLTNHPNCWIILLSWLMVPISYDYLCLIFCSSDLNKWRARFHLKLYNAFPCV